MCRTNSVIFRFLRDGSETGPFDSPIMRMDTPSIKVPSDVEMRWHAGVRRIYIEKVARVKRAVS
jgi:hypothetical protein